MLRPQRLREMPGHLRPVVQPELLPLEAVAVSALKLSLRFVVFFRVRKKVSRAESACVL